MLIGLNPILSGSLLNTLRDMGHGDEIAIVDGNYPAQEDARRLVRLDGVALIPAVEAILSVLPVDDFVEEAIFRSVVKGDETILEPVHAELIKLCRKRAPKSRIVPLIGDAFYGRVKACHTVVATSEARLYANLIIRKGVIYPA